MATIPNHIIDEMRKLNNALAAVAKHSQTIEAWAAKRIGDDYATDYYHEARLDMVYEFDAAEALEMLADYLDEYGA